MQIHSLHKSIDTIFSLAMQEKSMADLEKLCEKLPYICFYTLFCNNIKYNNIYLLYKYLVSITFSKSIFNTGLFMLNAIQQLTDALQAESR